MHRSTASFMAQRWLLSAAFQHVQVFVHALDDVWTEHNAELLRSRTLNLPAQEICDRTAARFWGWSGALGAQEPLFADDLIVAAFTYNCISNGFCFPQFATANAATSQPSDVA